MLRVYAATLGLSALLMFAVQPIVSKILLPVLGGNPSVWNATVMFFQLILLLGYAYVHLGRELLGTHKQALVHAGVLVVSLWFMPLSIAPEILNAPEHTQPVAWLIGVLLMTVAVPFFALSTNAPLLSSWLAASTSKAAKNPYPLYAASNIGSMAGLLSYPVIVEPFLTLKGQRLLWSFGYVALVAMVALSLRMYLRTRSEKIKTAKKVKPVSNLRRAHWVLLAFVPSSLMLSITTHITIDIAPIPLLWVVPLALYLLSFVFVFANTPIGVGVSRKLFIPIVLPLVLLLAIAENKIPIWPWLIGLAVYVLVALFRNKNLMTQSLRTYGMPLAQTVGFFVPLLILFSGKVHYLALCLWYVAGFFLVCMICHGRLSELKPVPAQLTEFYFFLSLGGALGGAFNVLLAPQLFNNLHELPIVLALSFFLLPREKIWNDPKPVAVAMVAAVFFALLCYGQYRSAGILDDVIRPFNEWMWGLRRYFGTIGFATKSDTFVFFAILAPMLAAYRLRRNTIAMGAMASVLLLANIFMIGSTQQIHFQDRNFFGTLSAWFSQGQMAMYLTNGSTQHGFQFKDKERAMEPTSYYSWDGPLGALVQAMRVREGGAGTEIAAIGLGAGTVACLAENHQRTTFFEINPMVDAIAHEPKLFSFLRDCPGSNRVVMGDARLSMQTQPDHFYSLIILDAFNSDAIPIHLLTKEALDLYLDKLAPRGVLAYHISNRHLDLKSVVGNLAATQHLAGIYGYFAGSNWVLLARDPNDLGALTQDPRFTLLVPDEGKRVWTDDYSNILSILNAW